MKKILILFAVLILCSCRNKLLFMMYGIDSTPDPKSSAYIQSYIEKNKLPAANQYLTDSTAFSEISKWGKMITHYMIFDKNGYFLKDTFQNSCPGNTNLEIENFIKQKYYIVDPARKLNMITDHLVDSRGEKIPLAFNNKAAYYIVLTWATWAGRLNKEGYLKWYQQAYLLKDKYELEILNVNVDLLKNIKNK